MISDPIADMLTRIRNAQATGHQIVDVPYSRMKMALAKVLEREHFVASVNQINDERGRAHIRICLRYERVSPTKRTGAITGIRRVSRVGQRRYARVGEIGRVRSGYGIAILTTPKGVMTDADARREKVGGEVVCEVW